MKNLKIIFALSISVAALTGCWDQDIEDGNGEMIGVYVPITSSVSANFVKGPVDGANCELLEVTGSGALGDSIASGMTAAGVVDFGDDIEYLGPVLVRCFGGSYTDEATGGMLTAPEMRAVASLERDAVFSVTPLTEIAVQRAEVDGDLNTAISVHSGDVAGAFGFSGDIDMVIPTDLASVEASNNYEGQYATALALISQLHSNTGGTLSDLINDLSEDLADGEFSAESLDSMSQAVTDLESSSVAANLNDDALATIVDRAGIPVEDDSEQSGVVKIEEEADDISPSGNDILSVSLEIVEDNLVITQTHAAAKDTWHEIRAYFTVDDSDTTMNPIAAGAASLVGLNAEYGYVFTFNDGVDPLEWYVSKQDVSAGSWVQGTTVATVSGGDTDVTTMTIPLSEIGSPADIADIQMMFVGTGAGWGTDQIPNDGMYQHVWPIVVELVETDDIGMAGNDIESVSAEIVDSNLVVTQTHKGAKDTWHEIRTYLTVDDSDTTMSPIAGGAASLTGLNAEYGYVFTFNDGVDPLEWYVAKYEVSAGSWVEDMTVATVTGGDTDVTTITIPLSEIGDPVDISEIQMMFVGTGAGWGTDQIPNDGMYQYVAPAVETRIADAADEGISPEGNDIVTVSISNDDTHLMVSQTHLGVLSTWHEVRLYANYDSSDTVTTPLANGSPSITGLVAEYGYAFTFNDGPDPLEWYVAKSDVSAGAWVVGTTTATVTGGDIDVTTLSIPLSELGNPVAGETIQLMFVATASGWGNDQAPNDAMLDYVIQ